ncbi:LacI family DNA-binding transcriptional regulator [Actinomadura sp. 7K507]|uniref:LacI family DNA-binding transcriptional regulator n=1 Tax=Actinomadura sp. 7K507 TaxID=2530365 RepID=UPI00104A66A3|nr:LacI family DNA-binding transcriptional regulator [Actinomadura sp. 7K507]TDC73268.1 LacI family transcriptional regulator [Actinomadura sp. 7K507]
MPRRPESGDPAAPARPATSVDVARLAGVSRATVSHVLNDQVERFNADTVERVRSAAAALGYVRSAAGRALVMGRSDFIVVVVPYATFQRLQDVVEVLSADIAELGFNMVVHFSPSQGSGTSPIRLQHLVETLRPAGIVDLGGLLAPDLEILKGAGCPVLSPETSAGGNDRIGLVQARHLRSRGYTELAYAFLSDARDDPYGRERARAVAQFCAAEDLDPPDRIHVPIEPDGAYRALEKLVERRGRPVGIACYNDQVALALVFAAQRLGLAVPGDVALVGAESLDVGQVVAPRLTTVTGDVTALLRPFRRSLARTYGGPAAPGGAPSLAQAFTILPGETT